MTAEAIIKKLNLTSHPEGGYFIEIKKSEERLTHEVLPERYKSSRSFYTSIYYLLNENDKSHFHRVNSDETWYFHYGSSVVIHLLSEADGYSKVILGNRILEDEKPQFTVPRGTWFGAELVDSNSYGLFSCNVAPGFEYEDFELADKKYLLGQFPDQEKIISKLTLK